MNEAAGSLPKLRWFSYAAITGNEGNFTSSENTWTFFSSSVVTSYMHLIQCVHTNRIFQSSV